MPQPHDNGPNTTEEDVTQKWFDENPGELPSIIEDEAMTMGVDIDNDGQRAMLRSMLEDDPDLFGDWDRYE